jgi:uncharacterized protein (DUF488 family)
MNLLTLGHGTMSEEEFIDLVCGIGVSRVVDIRSVPGSRHNSQFGRADMEGWLPAAGVEYGWEEALGGFRKTSPGLTKRSASPPRLPRLRRLHANRRILDRG